MLTAALKRLFPKACVFALVAACGRTPLLPPYCDAKIDPVSIDFGQVAPGDSATREVRVTNHGGGECHLSDIGLSPTSDASFVDTSPTSAIIPSGGTAPISIKFQPASVAIPLDRKGELTFDVDSVRTRHSVVALTGTVLSSCKLDVSPLAVAFGHVALGAASVRSVRAANVGSGPCEIANLAISPGSDSQFGLESTPDPMILAPGDEEFISVSFTAKEISPPHHRTGSLVFASTDVSRLTVTVSLSADIDIGCELTWVPASLDFGNVMLNTTADGHVSLGNDGSDPCLVSGIDIAAGSDPNFKLGSTQLMSVVVAPGATATVGVTFAAADSSPPHLKTGTLVFQTGNSRQPSAQVPLSAYVNTVCVEASRWIYTFDDSGGLARFDPDTLTFTDIATPDCPTLADPNSMAVDQNATAWVAYMDGSMYRVDTTTGVCQTTSFVPNQHGLNVFGMSFVFDPSTGKDTLYIAGGAEVIAAPSTLATISFPELLVTPVGTVGAGFPELTGTGDGQLWGFIPQDSSTSYQATLLRLDPMSAATLQSYSYSSLNAFTEGGWAVKFWGGYFWIFLDTAVYKVSRDTPANITTAIADTRRRPIVGAGVSTCAPVQ